jgi:hypothetical protein
MPEKSLWRPSMEGRIGLILLPARYRLPEGVELPFVRKAGKRVDV